MMTRIFLAHPRSVDENYLQHARFAAGISARLALAAGAAALHAVIPALCARTASRLIADLHDKTHARGVTGSD